MDTEQQPPVLIETLEKLDEALDYWKNTTFSQHYLKLGDVVESLRKPRHGGHLVDARQEYAARWVPIAHASFALPEGGNLRLCGRRQFGGGTRIWTQGTSFRLEKPLQLASQRVAYTMHDKSLWDAQKVFEEYVMNANKFNPGKKGRREFQNGLGYTQTFHLSSQIFVKRSAYTRTKEASRTYPLHDWIKNGTKKDEEGGLRPLSEGFPPTLKVGDLVWMSFSVEFFIGNMFWSTNFIPYEIVRIGSVALELLPNIKKEFDEDVEEEEPRERLGVGMRGISAAAAHQLNAVGDLLPVPPVEQPAGIATEPHTDLTAIEANAIASAHVPCDPDSSRNLLPENIARPRSPLAFIDSESEERTTTDEDDINGGTQPDDEENMTQDYMSMDEDSFIVDDDSSLTDVGASLTDDAALFIDDTASLARDDASVAEGSASAADDDASVLALVSPPASNGRPIKRLNNVNRSEVVQQRADDAPKLNGRKRPASSERVLRKRLAKGKGVAK
ncbi:hypothetical protein LXA43DRAFT_1065835 [Ganoderma leucocontextum]|nr:hypothetical protein LXA43DRAFT_1065835 [Ganoderma leucocontextum]